jgi:hypothetical protein
MELLPARFIDRRRREWRLELNYTLGKHIADVTGLDFINARTTARALLGVMQSDETLVQVLWLFCEEQAAATNVDEEEFGRGLDGLAPGIGDQRAGGVRPKFLPPRPACGHPSRAGEGSRSGGGASGAGGDEGPLAGVGPGDGDEDGRGVAGDRSAAGDGDRDLWRLGYQLAGVVGVGPGPYSLRQLIWMADGVAQERAGITRRSCWQRCANSSGIPSAARPFTADEFHPYLRTAPRGTPLTGELLRAQAQRWFAEQSKKRGDADGLHGEPEDR